MSKVTYSGNLALAVGLAMATAACGSPSSAPAPTGQQTQQLSCAADLVQHDGRTTSGELALANLEAQLEGRLAYVDRHPHDLGGRKQAVGLLMSRSRFTGSYQDFAQALEHAEAALDAHPDQGEAHALMASVLSALHRFDEALAELDRADALGVDTLEARDVIDVARGDNLEEVLARRLELAEAFPNYKHLTALAAVEGALGLYDDADASYLAALESYRDVSPFPIAWVAFRRGVMWSEQAGRRDRGCALYREAVAILPSYVVANVHLAEIERHGDPVSAAARLRRVVASTYDPEPSGLLGTVLGPTEPEAAAGYVAAAEQRYGELLDHYPLAFADHAAEFFMGPGHQPARALDLALSNLANRPTERAYDLAIRAASAAGNPELGCQLASEAGTPFASHPLETLLEQMAVTCAAGGRER
jgi:tetratricopeptide (TPR) repeat protein